MLMPSKEEIQSSLTSAEMIILNSFIKESKLMSFHKAVRSDDYPIHTKL